MKHKLAARRAARTNAAGPATKRSAIDVASGTPETRQLGMQMLRELATGEKASGMLDVSRFKLGDACPRCVDRRVYAVDEEKNLWLCIANAMPVPWARSQLTEHDAAEFADDEDFDRSRDPGPQVKHV